MFRSYLINKYLSKEFLKVVFKFTLAFLCLGFVMDLFEEINFFKDYDVGFGMPMLLAALFIPSLFYNMFPFVILLSGIWFFLKIKKSDEITGMQVAGMSNFSIIVVPSILSFILGIIFIAALNPVTSALIKKYEVIKGKYEVDKDYLAAITENGIWIKERKNNKNSLIRSTSLEGENLTQVTIYEFNENNDFVRRIESKTANIKSTTWILKDALVFNNVGDLVYKNNESLPYLSIYDLEKIRTLYKNLDTISFWNLKNEIKILEERGYSTREMRSKLQRSIAFPFFLLSMLLLSGVFTLGFQFKENNWTYIFIALIASVIIYFFNDFSTVLGKTEKLPLEISVWMPIIVIFLFSAVGVIHANQK